MKKTIPLRGLIVIAIFLTVVALSPAGSGWADSPDFTLNLLSPFAGGTYGVSSSGSFSLNLYPVRRASADSGTFSYDWLSNCNPGYGLPRDAGQVAGNNFLKQLSGASWVDAFSTPAEGSTVIIINHGWNSSPEGLLALANQIASQIPSATIYLWDWGNGTDTVSDANPNGKPPVMDFAELLGCEGMTQNCLLSAAKFAAEIEITKNNAYSHGRQLGDVLIAYNILPTRYNIHMIGHSFGGIVCAEAAKKLYAKTNTKVKQLTTLDTPALLWPNAVKSINADTFERVEVLYYDWRTELLLGATGGPLAGNYSNVLNLELNPFFFYNFFPLHSESVDWYEASVPPSAINCENNRYGFGWSFAWSPFAPYWDIWGGQEELWGYGQGCLLSWGEVVEAVTEKVVDTAKEGFESAAQWMGNQAVVVMDNIGNAINSSVKLTTYVGPVSLAEGQMTVMTEQSEPNEAYIYTTLQIPADAEQVVFDLRFESVGVGDVLTFSIGNTVLITIDAESVGVSGNYNQSYPASIREYAGQTVTVQFTLRPAGQGTTSVLIDNLRFIKLTLPADFDGSRAVDVNDLIIIADQWLLNPGQPSADIAPAPNGDNKVNMEDFLILAKYWNIVLPEPNSL